MSSILTGAIVAVLAWFVTNWVGKPILDTRQARIKALQAAEQNAYVGYEASEERVKEARAALRDAASSLQSISRGHSWLVRRYCRLFRYDLEAAASALIRLHDMTGDRAASQQGRQMSPIVKSGGAHAPFSLRNTSDGRSLGRGWRWPMGASRASVAGGGGLAWLAAGGLWAEVAAFWANATLRKTELSTATHMTAWSAKVGFIFASSIGSANAGLMHDQSKTD